jgi:hypothetical protein
MTRLPIERDWQGLPLAAADQAWIAFERAGEQLDVAFDAPYFGDPPPPMAAGAAPGLWEFEVIELFIAGPGEEYLELEFGPHGHYLVLQLCGVRKAKPRPSQSALPLTYAVQIEGGRYRGRAQVPMSYLPDRSVRVNAYTIHGQAGARRYAAHAPVAGARPDFHRLECFVPLGW